MEKNRILKNLNELEEEFKKGNLSKPQYKLKKGQLNQKLEDFAVAERVMKLQGKKSEETPTPAKNTDENDELFKKYITATGLKKKKLDFKKGLSKSTIIASAILILAFFIGIGFGIYALDIPGEVSSVSLSTNDTAFPPYVNNTTNVTNTANNGQLVESQQQYTGNTEIQTTETTTNTQTQQDTTPQTQQDTTPQTGATPTPTGGNG